MKILIIGGTGNISWRVASLLVGHDVSCMCRSTDSPFRRKISGFVRHIHDDINNCRHIGHLFDVVIDFVCYNKDQMKKRIEMFSGKCDRYVFISTTAVYGRQNITGPITEKCVEYSQWGYAVSKFEAELELSYSGMPFIIIRPGNIYDTIFPCCSVGNPNWTIPERIINRKPIVQHGDGTTLWSPLHSYDFASALYGVIINEKSKGRIVNIAGDEPITWNGMIDMMYGILCERPNVVYVPSSVIHSHSKYYGNSVFYHKQFNDVYDLSVLKSLVPEWNNIFTLRKGLKNTVLWYASNQERKVVNNDVNQLQDTLCGRYGLL